MSFPRRKLLLGVCAAAAVLIPALRTTVLSFALALFLAGCLLVVEHQLAQLFAVQALRGEDILPKACAKLLPEGIAAQQQLVVDLIADRTWRAGGAERALRTYR